MASVNSQIQLTIDNVVNGGFGIARHNGFVYFIPFAYPNEVVIARVTSTSKNFAWAKIEKIVEPSVYRKEFQCPNFLICGGCLWGALDYSYQVELKKALLKDNLNYHLRYSGDITFLFDISNIYHYRTRATFHSDGKHLGFYQLRSKKVIDVSPCIVIHPKIVSLYNDIKNIVLKNNLLITVHPYNEEFLLFTDKQNNLIAEKYTIQYNFKDSTKERRYFLFESIPIVNGCFSQSSLILNRLLRNAVINILYDKERILDLYCGSGNFTITLERNKHVTGIDIDPIAIQYAQKLSNFDYKMGDEDVMIKHIQDYSWDIILLDPPRVGAKKITYALAHAKTPYILYVSCDPVTLCRDIKSILQTSPRWTIQKVLAVDMFPHTPHIETIVLLSKN